MSLSQEEIDACHEAFREVDVGRRGHIDVWELRIVLLGESIIYKPRRNTRLHPSHISHLSAITSAQYGTMVDASCIYIVVRRAQTTVENTIAGRVHSAWVDGVKMGCNTLRGDEALLLSRTRM